MKINPEELEQINARLNEIIEKAKEFEDKFAEKINKVLPVYRRSARNLVHYMAFRTFEIDELQQKLRDLGLSSLSSIEAHVMDSLLNAKTIINHLLNNPVVEDIPGVVRTSESRKLLKRNTKLLFGYKSKKRLTRIMVTLPGEAATDYEFVQNLLEAGMNSARINCAHDTPDQWLQMIENVQRAKKTLHKNCKVMMDLAGPKLRTGEIKPGPQVIRLKPSRNVLGQVIKPARVWLAPQGAERPSSKPDAVIPVEPDWLANVKRHSKILFTDSRNKKCEITMEGREGAGRWGICYESAYLTTGTDLVLKRTKKSGKEIVKTGELLPLEQFINLNIDDTLLLTREAVAGENAEVAEDGTVLAPAHISCTLPEIFDDVKAGEPIYFDDGKIEGIIEEAGSDSLKIRITYARDKGGKLKADKGINLPDSDLQISGLTEKDKNDLKFVAQQADAINFSFVNSETDVQELLDELNELDAELGIIFKIETKKGFKNLPLILLKGMETYPIGVMIARGDLAIETGWNNFASIQEEILRICEAAHIPDVWATQVLENLAKKGVPSRAEITDAALANRAECVMLNKGFYITKAVKMLDKILRRMQRFQKKKDTLLPRLDEAENLQLSHDQFDV
ncbi:pyruvate kinase [Draconibacterium sp. IB214405]|uniref:pyruvate kinase n=1 Tax=Draconibacterium sp. IB214405 TaxID=3097352 RepID=UPI002A0F1EA9|nr:pyruvate kinase [Draconibacterium sp. IB214405]MDX8341493.1 pyruvate kinase [Draconibacterium sp. IB214405]